MRAPKSLASFLAVVIITLGISISIQSLLAWAPPASLPPNGNTPAPINVSATGQAKNAGIVLNHTNSTGNGLVVEYGNVGIGTAAPDNAQGWNRVLNLHGQSHAKFLVTESPGVKTGIFSHTGYNGKIGTESNHNLTLTAGYWNDVMTLTTGGNVGIGTLNPSVKLTVAGGHGDTKLRLYSTGDGSTQPANLSFWASEPGWTYSGTGLGYNVNGSPYYGRIDSARGSSYVRFLPGETKFEFQNTSNVYTSNVLVLKESGNVGIGTTAPGQKLDVNGNARATQFCLGSNCVSDWASLGDNLGNHTATTNLNMANYYVSGASAYKLTNGFELQQGGSNYGQFNSWVHLNGYYGLYSANNGAHFYPNNSSYGAWKILGTRNGYGGINYNGRTTLMMQDDLIGLYNEYYGRWIIYGYGSTGNTYIAPNGGNIYLPGSGIWNSSGYVGIGTASPGAKLDVYGDIISNGSNMWMFHTPDDGRTTLYFGRWSNGTIAEWPIAFNAGGGASFNGSVSIGGDLGIAGQITVGGGADLAEEFTTDRDYEEGSVLIMDDSGYKSARECDQADDLKVVGVVSDNPSVIMGKVDSPYKAIVAMVGVVTVKVTAMNGEIKKGDMLTTSSVKGRAMKSTEQKTGTIIGKALEDFSGEEGEIMALINLR